MENLHFYSIAEGDEYGHTPGRSYDDVIIELKKLSNGKWRCEIRQEWGQGHESPDRLLRVVDRNESWKESLSDAIGRAEQVGIDPVLLALAQSDIEDKAYSYEEENEEMQENLE